MTVNQASYATPPAAHQGAAQTALKGSGNGVFAAGGAGFLELMLANITAPAAAATDTAGTTNATAFKTKVATDLTATDAPSGQTFMDFLNHLLAGIPAENRPVALQLDTVDTQAEMNVLAQDDTGASPALIAAGLSPEDLTKFMEDLAARTQNGESFIVGLIKMQAASDADRQPVYVPGAILLGQGGKQNISGLNSDAFAELSAQLNSLIGEAGDSAKPDSGFDKILRILEQAQQGAKNAGATAKADTQQALSAGLSTIQTSAPPPLVGLDFSGGLSGEIYPDGASWSHVGGPSPGVMTVTGTSLMTSYVGHVPQAGQPHPATQIVATTITKAALDGDTKNITVKLDPPELGRVEVRMVFAKDKGLKAHMLVEKHETYLMLQRDAHMLEKALQDAGLDAGSSGLSFELADGNQFDNGDNSRGGENASGGGSTDAQAEDGVETIEASVDWHIDPATGMTRYNILA